MMKKSLKAISFFTLVCFVPTQFFSPAQGWSAAPSQPEVRILLPDAFQIPEDLGRIENTASNSGPALIHIQTAHGNYEAQQKIRGLLHYLKHTYGIKTLFIEGSISKLEPERLRFFPDDMPLTMKIADDLTRKAYVKGAELFLLEEKNAEAYGIENAKIYNAGGKAFLEVLTQQKKTGDFVRSVDTQIDRLEGILLNKDLRAFLKRLEDYEADRLPVMDWLSWLKTEATKRLEMNLEDPAWQIDWPMLVRLFKLQEIERKIDLPAYQKERENFIKAVSRFVPSESSPHGFRRGSPTQSFGDDMERVLSPSFSHQSLPYPQTEILFEKMVSALPPNFDYEAYPNVKLFIGHLILQSEISAGGGSAFGGKADLLKETEALADKISEKLAVAPDEKKILLLLKNYRLLQKLFRLELTPREYDVIAKNRQRVILRPEGPKDLRSFPFATLRVRMTQESQSGLRPSQVINQFLSLNSAKRVKDIRFGHLEEIDLLFDKALEYYRFVKDRDHWMIENIEKRMKEKGIEKAAVITGGFHSQPFTDYFTDKGYRYALVSPKITTLDGREAYVDSALKMGFDLESSTTETMSLMDPAARTTEVAKQDILQIITRDLPAGRHLDSSFLTFPTRSEARAEEGTEFQNRLWDIVERSRAMSGPQLLAEAQWLFSQALPENKAKLRDSEKQALQLADAGRERRQREKADLFAQIKKVTSVHAENIAVLHKTISQPSLKGLNPETKIVFLFFAGMAARILSLPFGYDRLKTPPKVELPPDLELDEMRKRLDAQFLRDEQLNDFYHLPLLLVGGEDSLSVNPFLAVRGAGLQPEREHSRFMSFLMNRENPVLKIEAMKPPREGEPPFLRLSLKNVPAIGESDHFRFFLLKERLPDFPEVTGESRQEFLNRYFVKDARELERFALTAEEGPRKKLEKVTALLREYMAPEKILAQNVYSLFSEEGVSRFARFLQANEREGKAIEFLYRQRIAVQDRDIRDTVDPRGTIQKSLTAEELGLREQKIIESVQKWENHEKLILQKAEEEKRKLSEKAKANRTVLERFGISAEKADGEDQTVALKLRKERELLPWMESFKVDGKNFFEPWFRILFQRKEDGVRLIPEDPAGNLISHFDRLRRELGKLSFDKNFTVVREKVVSSERVVFDFEVLRALLEAMDSKAHKKDPGREALSQALLPAAETAWKTPLLPAPTSRFYRAAEVLSLEAEIKKTEEEFRRNLTRPGPEDSVLELEAGLQKIQTLRERQAQGVSPFASSEKMAALDLKNQEVFEKSLEGMRAWVEKLAAERALAAPLKQPSFGPDFVELRRLFQQEDFERFFPLAKELLEKKGGKEESLSKLISQMSGNYSAWILLQAEELENASKFEEALALIKKALTETSAKELLLKKTALEEKLSIQKTGFPAEIIDEARRLWKAKGDALKKDNKRRIEREFLEAFQSANLNSGTIRNRAEKIIARWKSHANPSANPDYDRAIHALAGRVDDYFKEEDLRRSEARPAPADFAVQRHWAAARSEARSQAPENFKRWWEERRPEIEKPLIEWALTKSGGVLLRAAQLLTINRNTLTKTMKAYGLTAAEYTRLTEDTTAEAINLQEVLNLALSKAIEEAMVATGGNRTQAAQLLGVSREFFRGVKAPEKVPAVSPGEASAVPEKLPHFRPWPEREEELEKKLVLTALPKAKFSNGKFNMRELARLLGVGNALASKLFEKYKDEKLPPLAFQLDVGQKWDSMEVLKKKYIISALIFYQGEANYAIAEQIKINRDTLRNLARDLNINPEFFEKHPLTELVVENKEAIRFILNETEKKALYEKILAELSKNKERINTSEGRERIIRAAEVLGQRFVLSARSFFEIESYKPLSAQVENLREQMKILSDDELAARARELKERIAEKKEKLEEQLVPAFAIFSEAARRKTRMEPSREQIFAALAIHRGRAVEMKPGEGKTLSIALAAFVNALLGRGVHIHTFNDYLAKRDAELMTPVFLFLGLKVGFIEHSEKKRAAKRDAYSRDITYGSKELFVFDFLGDRMVYDKNERVQRPEAPALVVVDEGDSVLLDEAADPLVRGVEEKGKGWPDDNVYLQVYRFAASLREGEDFNLDPFNRDAEILPEVFTDRRKELKAIRWDLEELKSMIRQALVVRHFYERKSEYVIEGNKVVLVDEFTGRLKMSHVLGNHKHQLIAAKEIVESNGSLDVEIQSPVLSHNLITYQNYYRGIKEQSTFSMITGTLGNEVPEINQVYGLDFVGIPLQFKSKMIKHPPVITSTKEEKDQKIIQKIREIHARGNPVVIFVRRISDVENLKEKLSTAGIQAETLHGLSLKDEAEVLSHAGEAGRVTIVTNVAGRGVNIQITDQVRELGGLNVILTKIHTSRRIDDQQEERVARRNDPGESSMFLSLEDESFQRFGGPELSESDRERVKNEDDFEELRLKIQENGEAFLRAMRGRALAFDDALAPHRRNFYQRRDHLLDLLEQKTPRERLEILKPVDDAWRDYLGALDHNKYRAGINYQQESEKLFQSVSRALDTAMPLRSEARSASAQGPDLTLRLGPDWQVKEKSGSLDLLSGEQVKMLEKILKESWLFWPGVSLQELKIEIGEGDFVSAARSDGGQIRLQAGAWKSVALLKFSVMQGLSQLRLEMLAQQIANDPKMKARYKSTRERFEHMKKLNAPLNVLLNDLRLLHQHTDITSDFMREFLKIRDLAAIHGSFPAQEQEAVIAQMKDESLAELFKKITGLSRYDQFVEIARFLSLKSGSPVPLFFLGDFADNPQALMRTGILNQKELEESVQKILRSKSWPISQDTGEWEEKATDALIYSLAINSPAETASSLDFMLEAAIQGHKFPIPNFDLNRLQELLGAENLERLHRWYGSAWGETIQHLSNHPEWIDILTLMGPEMAAGVLREALPEFNEEILQYPYVNNHAVPFLKSQTGQELLRKIKDHFHERRFDFLKILDRIRLLEDSDSIEKIYTEAKAELGQWLGRPVVDQAEAQNPVGLLDYALRTELSRQDSLEREEGMGRPPSGDGSLKELAGKVPVKRMTDLFIQSPQRLFVFQATLMDMPSEYIHWLGGPEAIVRAIQHLSSKETTQESSVFINLMDWPEDQEPVPDFLKSRMPKVPDDFWKELFSQKPALFNSLLRIIKDLSEEEIGAPESSLWDSLRDAAGDGTLANFLREDEEAFVLFLRWLEAVLENASETFRSETWDSFKWMKENFGDKGLLLFSNNFLKHTKMAKEELLALALAVWGAGDYRNHPGWVLQVDTALGRFLTPGPPGIQRNVMNSAILSVLNLKGPEFHEALIQGWRKSPSAMLGLTLRLLPDLELPANLKDEADLLKSFEPFRREEVLKAMAQNPLGLLPILTALEQFEDRENFEKPLAEIKKLMQWEDAGRFEEVFAEDGGLVVVMVMRWLDMTPERREAIRRIKNQPGFREVFAQAGLHAVTALSLLTALARNEAVEEAGPWIQNVLAPRVRKRLAAPVFSLPEFQEKIWEAKMLSNLSAQGFLPMEEALRAWVTLLKQTLLPVDRPEGFEEIDPRNILREDLFLRQSVLTALQTEDSHSSLFRLAEDIAAQIPSFFQESLAAASAPRRQELEQRAPNAGRNFMFEALLHSHSDRASINESMEEFLFSLVAGPVDPVLLRRGMIYLLDSMTVSEKALEAIHRHLRETDHFQNFLMTSVFEHARSGQRQTEAYQQALRLLLLEPKTGQALVERMNRENLEEAIKTRIRRDAVNAVAENHINRILSSHADLVLSHEAGEKLVPLASKIGRSAPLSLEEFQRTLAQRGFSVSSARIADDLNPLLYHTWQGFVIPRLSILTRGFRGSRSFDDADARYITRSISVARRYSWKGGEFAEGTGERVVHEWSFPMVFEKLADFPIKEGKTKLFAADNRFEMAIRQNQLIVYESPAGKLLTAMFGKSHESPKDQMLVRLDLPPDGGVRWFTLPPQDEGQEDLRFQLGRVKDRLYIMKVDKNVALATSFEKSPGAGAYVRQVSTEGRSDFESIRSHIHLQVAERMLVEELLDAAIQLEQSQNAVDASAALRTMRSVLQDLNPARPGAASLKAGLDGAYFEAVFGPLLQEIEALTAKSFTKKGILRANAIDRAKKNILNSSTILRLRAEEKFLEGTFDPYTRELMPDPYQAKVENRRNFTNRFLTFLRVHPAPSKEVRRLYEKGDLDYFFHEFTRLRGITQKPGFHQNITADEHTLRVLEAMDGLLTARPSVSHPEYLRLLALFHDIGKGQEPGRGHEELSAQAIRQFLESVERPEPVIERFELLVRLHQVLGNIAASRVRRLAKPERAAEVEAPGFQAAEAERVSRLAEALSRKAGLEEALGRLEDLYLLSIADASAIPFPEGDTGNRYTTLFAGELKKVRDTVEAQIRTRARSEVRSQKRVSDVPDPFPAVYVMNKPLKYVSALQRDHNSPDTPAAMELLPPGILQKKGHIMGRLDENTEGLLLYGGDSKLMGYLLDHLSYPENSVNKVYTAVVEVEGDVTEENLKSLREGVTIRIATKKGYADHFAKAVEAAVLDRFSEKGKAFTRVSLVLNEGKKYQVRKMLAKVGHPVLQLMRVAVGKIELGNLESGKWREATPEEYAWLKEIYRAGIAADQEARAARKQAGGKLEEGEERASLRSEARMEKGGKEIISNASRVRADAYPSGQAGTRYIPRQLQSFLSQSTNSESFLRPPLNIDFHNSPPQNKINDTATNNRSQSEALRRYETTNNEHPKDDRSGINDHFFSAFQLLFVQIFYWSSSLPSLLTGMRIAYYSNKSINNLFKINYPSPSGFSRSEVRTVVGEEALRKINSWSAEEFFDKMRAGYESGALKRTSKYEEWAALKTKQEKIQGAGVLVFRKIQGQWKILLGRQTWGDSKGFYVVPSGTVDKKSNARFEKAANIAELIRLKIADQNDRKTAEQESVPAGALRELHEETGIRGRIAGRFNDNLVADKALRMNYFVHIDDSGSPEVEKGNGELVDPRWVPLWVILQSEEGKAGENVESYLKGGRLLEGSKLRGFNEVKKVLMALAGPPAQTEEIEMEGRTKITRENMREFLRPGGYILHSQEGVGKIAWVEGNKEGDPRAFKIQVLYLDSKGLIKTREYNSQSSLLGLLTATADEKEIFDKTRREGIQAKKGRRDTRVRENLQELQSVPWTPYGAPFIRGVNATGTTFSREAAGLRDRKEQIFHFGNASEVERKILYELLGSDFVRKFNISEGDIRSKMGSRKKQFLEKLNQVLDKDGRLSQEAMAKVEENILKSELFQKWLNFSPAAQESAKKEDIRKWIQDGFIYVEWILKYEIEKNSKIKNKISINPRPLPRSEVRSFQTPVNLEIARTLAKFTLGIFLLRAVAQWQRSELQSMIETFLGHSIAYTMPEAAATDPLAQLGPGPFQFTQEFLSSIQQGAGYQIVEYDFLKLLMKSPLDLRKQLEVYEKIQGGSAEPVAVTFLPEGVTQEAFIKDILKALGQKSGGVTDSLRKKELAERIAVKIPAQGQSVEQAMAGYAREKQGKVAVVGLGAKAVPGLLKFAVLEEDMEHAANLPIVSYYMAQILQIAHEIDPKLQPDTIKQLTAKYLEGMEQAAGNVFILSKITELALRALSEHTFESAA